MPVKPFNTNLWPASWPQKVWRSDVGIVLMGAVLAVIGKLIGARKLPNPNPKPKPKPSPSPSPSPSPNPHRRCARPSSWQCSSPRSTTSKY